MKYFSKICISTAIALSAFFSGFSYVTEVTVFADSTDSSSAISSELAAADSYLHPDIEITPTENALKDRLMDFLEDTPGTWSIYVKNLSTDESFSINNQSMYAASLIKLFVMEDCFAHLNTMIDNASSDGGSDALGYDYIMGMMADMIEVSDNDAYYNLVKLRTDADTFVDGCLQINSDIWDYGYYDTGIYHSLVPATTEYTATSEERNHTSVSDCGELLEKIHRGTCVSETASKKMLDFLLNQETDTKIPAALPEGTEVANKTGETDENEHDAAIVYGPETDYILCVMSSDIPTNGSAVDIVQEISDIVYDYLN